MLHRLHSSKLSNNAGQTLDLPHLSAFLAVAETLHFGHAAERLHIAQPALSARVRTLETSLGVPLFERTTRSVRLTRAGHELLPEARAVLAQAAKAAETARRAAGLDRPVLRLAGIDSAMAGLLPGVIRAFRQAEPQVDLRVAEMLTREATEALQRGLCDIAFGRYPPGGGMEGRLVLREPLVAVLPAQHRLAQHAAVAAEDLRGEQLVMPSRQHRPILYDIVTGYLDSCGVSLPLVLEANERHVMLALVAAGLGVSLAPAWIGKLQFDGVVYRPLQGDTPVALTYALWRRDDGSALLDRFLRQLSTAAD